MFRVGRGQSFATAGLCGRASGGLLQRSCAPGGWHFEIKEGRRMTKSKKRNSVATPDAAVPTAAEPEEVTLDQFADQDDEIPSKEWEYYHLWKAVHGCLFSLPEVFHLEFSLPGLRARDLPSANTLMGSAIEEHIPKALNKMRSIWDEDSKYADLIFKRQPQVFPDVVLVRAGDPKAVPVMGIEVKSWYALAGEGVPTFRMCVNRDYCHTWDLAMCVPWSLSYAVTGSVRLYRPLVISAKKAARLRNTYWRGLNHESLNIRRRLVLKAIQPGKTP
jgi:hypothetical protein